MKRTLADYTDAPDTPHPRHLSFRLRLLLVFSADPLTFEEIGHLSGVVDPCELSKIPIAMSRLAIRNLVKWVAKSTYQITLLGLKVQGELKQQLDSFPDGYEEQE